MTTPTASPTAAGTAAGLVAENGGPIIPPKRSQSQRNLAKEIRDHDSVQGWMNLVFTMGIGYVISVAVHRWHDGHTFIDTDLFVRTFASREMVEVLAVYVFLFVIAYGILPLTVARLGTALSFSVEVLVLVHFGTQLAVYCIGVVLLYENQLNWSVVPRASTFTQLTVLAMKTYSWSMYQAQCVYDHVDFDIGIREHVVYLFTPTLVYERDWPRTEVIRWHVLFQKFLYGSIAFLVMYVVATENIVPTLMMTPVLPPYKAVAALLLPFMTFQIGLWFFVFECVCVGFAELTYYRPRRFYDDWWNSTTFVEYSRKWNRPVHGFLLAHVYKTSLNRKHSRAMAALLTFLVSAILHEVFFIIIFHVFRFYFLMIMMMQIPLMLLSDSLSGTTIGNFIFWMGVNLGPPMQAVLYSREYFGGTSLFWEVQIPIISAGFGLFLAAVIVRRFNGTSAKKKD